MGHPVFVIYCHLDRFLVVSSIKGSGVIFACSREGGVHNRWGRGCHKCLMWREENAIFSMDVFWELSRPHRHQTWRVYTLPRKYQAGLEGSHNKCSPSGEGNVVEISHERSLESFQVSAGKQTWYKSSLFVTDPKVKQKKTVWPIGWSMGYPIIPGFGNTRKRVGKK